MASWSRILTAWNKREDERDAEIAIFPHAAAKLARQPTVYARCLQLNCNDTIMLDDLHANANVSCNSCWQVQVAATPITAAKAVVHLPNDTSATVRTSRQQCNKIG